MRVWTAHVRPGAAPVLVREGFSWSALVFGPLWLAARQAWIAAALALAAAASAALASPPWGGVLAGALGVALGVFGRDLWRWSLDARGFLLADVIVATDEDAAMARLLVRRPDLEQAALIEALR